MGQSTGFLEESLPFRAHLSGRADEAVLKGRGLATPLRAWLLACPPPAGFDGAEPPLQRSRPGILYADRLVVSVETLQRAGGGDVQRKGLRRNADSVRPRAL